MKSVPNPLTDGPFPGGVPLAAMLAYFMMLFERGSLSFLDIMNYLWYVR